MCLMQIGYIEWLLMDCFCCSVLACWHAVEAWPVCLFSQKVEFLCVSHADWLCRMVVNGLFLLFALACWHAVEAWPVCL